MSKPFLPILEFYITNVCNLNCENCNRLNNYKFSGHQKWSEWADTCKEWSNKIDLRLMRILGGEPTLNPDFKEWVYGLRKLWPNTEFEITTNGTRLKHISTFYQTLFDNNATLVITAHNRDRLQDINKHVDSMLVSPITEESMADFSKWPEQYNLIKDPTWPSVGVLDDFIKLPQWIQDECTNIHKIDPATWAKNSSSTVLVDSQGVCVKIEYAENFVTAPLKYNGSNRFRTYDSIPIEAHNVCMSKNCTHFMNGKIYKCHHVALLPEFQKQYLVEISNQDQILLDSYQPLSVSANNDQIIDFFNKLKNPIPQCKLCPSVLEKNTLHSTTEKPKVKKTWEIRH